MPSAPPKTTDEGLEDSDKGDDLRGIRQQITCTCSTNLHALEFFDAEQFIGIVIFDVTLIGKVSNWRP